MGANQTIPIPDNQPELDFISDEWRLFFVIFNSITAVVGSVGNLVTLLSTALSKKLWTVPNIYVAHLAIVDWIVCSLLLPVGIRAFLTGKPPTECSLLAYMTIMCLAASLYTLLAISLNRYVLIVKGRSLYIKMYTKRNVAISILLIWSLSAVILIPVWAGIGRFGFNVKYNACIYVSYDFDTYVYRSTVLSGLVFSPSVMFTAFSYVSIIKKLRASQRRIENHKKKQIGEALGSNGTPQRLANSMGNEQDSVVEYSVDSGESKVAAKKKTHTKKGSKRAMRTVISLATVFITFTVCWSPQGFTYVIDMNGKIPAFWYTLQISLAFMNSAVNVFIYAFLSRPHRQAYKHLLTCKFKKLRESR